MSILGKRISGRMVAAMAALMLLVGSLLPALSKTPPRRITLVARDMAFYVDGDGRTANPVIEARPGETLRVVLRNRDRGLTHDFAVPAVDAAMQPLASDEEGELVFTAPDEPGEYEYVCRPHLLMMKGTLKIVRPASR